jgi:hypothetical protein
VALDPVEITAGLAIGTGLGGAIEDTVRPRLESFRQGQWQAHPDVALTPGVAAEVAAENFATFSDMEVEAARNGYNALRFQHLYDVTLSAPGMGELLAMLRRGTINPGNFTHGLRKAKLEPMWDTGLADLANQKLSAPDIAYMVVRGVLPDDGMLGMSLPTQADNLNLPPQLPLDPVAEAALTGWNKERLRAFIGRSGLAMAPVMAAQARFRGILTQNDYELTIARGDLYPAYAQPVLEASRQILTAGEYAELQLRGYYDRATRLGHTRKHGMTDADSDLLYDVMGRGMSLHAAFIAERRGGVFDGPTDQIPAWALWQLERGNLRPEVYNLEWAQRHTLPSAFVIRSLLTDGAITEARGEELFLWEGWPADLAATVAQHYAAKSGGGGDPHVAKAQNQLWTTAHRSYVGEMIDGSTATTALSAAGVAAAAVTPILNLWNEERSLIRKQLTPAQVKKAYKDGLYTLTQATDALLARGYDQQDANTLLEE